MTQKIDIHTHILPGVDDGAGNWDMCRQMLLQSVEAGVTQIIATPHYLPWKKKASPEQIRSLCTQTAQQFKKETGKNIDIYPGNEIYYHIEFIDSLKNKKALTLADSRYVLIEFSIDESFKVICSAVHNLTMAGYIPVLAHVERYRNMASLERMWELRQMGALLQMNIEVLNRGLFDGMGRLAKKALRHEMIQFLASDMHNVTSRPPMKEEALLWAEKKLSAEYLQDILRNNGMTILQ